MITHKPSGWNTWDYRGFNRFVFLDRGRPVVALRYAIWDETVPPPTPDSKQIGRMYDSFRWGDVTRLGPHAPLGLPAELEFKAGEVAYAATARIVGGALVLRVEPRGQTVQRVAFLFDQPDGCGITWRSEQAGELAGAALEFEGAGKPTRYFLNLDQPYALGQAGQAATVRVRLGKQERSGRKTIDTGADEAAVAAIEAAPSPAITTTDREAAIQISGAGALADAPQAMINAVTWNTLYDGRRQLAVSPVSRDWCIDWRGPLVFCWDTYFAGVMAGYESPELARLNFETVNRGIDEYGFVPNYIMAHGAASLDRSMPPLGAYLIWKTQAACPNREWLKRAYPQLKRWHGFWMKHRGGRGNGLLRWGSDAEPFYEFPQLVPYNPTLRHSFKAANWESGLDNSPMYDDVPFSETTNTFELDDVGLSSYYAMDCEALAAIAAFLGKKKEAAAFAREHETIARRIDEQLWNEPLGMYCNRHWDGRFSERLSPTLFFPLLAGIPSRERAERMVREHLLNEREFWGEWVIPTITRNDPAFHDNDYWRGRIWAPPNFLVAQGLRRYRFDEAAAQLARKSLDLFMKNWRADGGVYENYNSVTGAGGDVWNAARLYHWGGLLVVVAMEELIDVEPAGWLRLGSLDFPGATLRNVCIGTDRYDVVHGAHLEASRNGESILRCNVPAIVRIPLHQSREVPIEISAKTAGELTLRRDIAGERAARVGDRLVRAAGPDGAPAVYRW